MVWAGVVAWVYVGGVVGVDTDHLYRVGGLAHRSQHALYHPPQPTTTILPNVNNGPFSITICN